MIFGDICRYNHFLNLPLWQQYTYSACYAASCHLINGCPEKNSLGK